MANSKFERNVTEVARQEYLIPMLIPELTIIASTADLCSIALSSEKSLSKEQQESPKL